MKIGKFRLVLTGVALAGAISLAFIMNVMKPEANAPLIVAALLMGLIRVGVALFKQRAKLRIERHVDHDRFIPIGSEIA